MVVMIGSVFGEILVEIELGEITYIEGLMQERRNSSALVYFLH